MWKLKGFRIARTTLKNSKFESKSYLISNLTINFSNQKIKVLVQKQANQ